MIFAGIKYNKINFMNEIAAKVFDNLASLVVDGNIKVSTTVKDISKATGYTLNEVENALDELDKARYIDTFPVGEVYHIRLLMDGVSLDV